tara:strand:+ start:289 stop:663 length:375 start_codon:yes stop_codon:yes gene_type:complete
MAVDMVKGTAKARWNGHANVVPMQQHEIYNISGFTDNGVGDHTFEFDTDFSTVNYSFFAMVGHTGGEITGGISVTQYDSDAVARAVGTTRISVAYGHYTSGPLSGHNFTKVDCNELDLVFFGDQ